MTKSLSAGKVIFKAFIVLLLKTLGDLLITAELNPNLVKLSEGREQGTVSRI